MSIDRQTRIKIAREFLQSEKRYLELGLIVEEALKAIRSEVVKETYHELGKAIDAILEASSSRGWKIQNSRRSHAFWRRLHKVDWDWETHSWAGVWVRVQGSRPELEFEICAERWPAGKRALGQQIRSTVEAFMKSNAESCREGPDNSQSKWMKFSLYFDGNEAFMTGSVEEGGKQITDLVSSLVEAVDQP